MTVTGPTELKVLGDVHNFMLTALPSSLANRVIIAIFNIKKHSLLGNIQKASFPLIC